MTTPDRPPRPNQFPSHLRDYEYRRLGTVSLLAGLDLHTGRVTEIVSDRHASKDFIALLGKLHECLSVSNPDSPSCWTTIRRTFQRKRRVGSVSIPNALSLCSLPNSAHGSTSCKPCSAKWRDRVASKQELIDRIHLYFEQINADPVIFRWKYQIDETDMV
jgi:hypothetical protein